MSPENHPVITLTSDFGLSDYFVGALKGVLLSRAKGAKLIDITHLIPKHDVVSGAFVLREISGYFPAGTIHLAIIDPGVGTARRKLIVKQAGQFFVAPDNGLLSYILKADVPEVFEVKTHSFLRFKESPTFAGRDHFAPIAAALASGYSPEKLGCKISDAHCIETLFFEKKEEQIFGKIVYFDHFGNAITNLTQAVLGEKLKTPDLFSLSLKGKHLQGLKRNYKASGAGEVGVIINSSGFLEVFVCCGSAQKILNLNLMDSILIN